MKLLIIPFFLLATGLHAEAVAKFEYLSGNVQYKLKGGQWKAAKIGVSLPPDTDLETGPRGQAVIIFHNGSKLTLHSLTHVNLESYGSGTYGTQTVMGLRTGRVVAQIAHYKQPAERNYFQVRTPTVVAGVRGTIQEISYSPDKGCEIKMLESASDIIDRARSKSVVPEGGKSRVTGGETVTADKVARREGGSTMTSQQFSTAGEQASSYSAGDLNFSGNPEDFLNFQHLYEKISQDVFEKARDVLVIEKL